MSRMSTFELGPVVDHPRQRREGPLGDLGPCVLWQGEFDINPKVIADAKTLDARFSGGLATPLERRPARNKMTRKSRPVVCIKALKDAVFLANVADQPPGRHRILGPRDLIA